MRTYKTILSAIIFLAALTAAGQTDSLKKNAFDTTGYARMRDSLTKVYTSQKDFDKMVSKQESKQRGLGSSLFGLNLDIILGVGITNTQFDVNGDTTGLSNAESKTGPLLGVNVNLNLLGFAIGTGFSYSSKGYKSNNEDVNANYINIPLMFEFNFDIGRTEIDIGAGPYLGILLGHDTSQYYTLKNIDLGIVGTLQGTYFFNRFMGALLGVKYEHGGLNDLLKSEGTNPYISSIKTRNWFIYSGIKFIL